MSLFLTWYDPGVSGWEAFSVADILFALTGLLAVAGLVVESADRTHATSIALLSITLLVAFVASLAAIYRTLDPPGDGLERALGAWLGLAGCLGVLVGIFRAMRDEGPERRSPERERRAAAEALQHAELIPLPGDAPAEPSPR